MSERLERVEAIPEVLARQTLANAQNTGRAFEAIAELREVVEQQNRAIAYLLSQD